MVEETPTIAPEIEETTPTIAPEIEETQTEVVESPERILSPKRKPGRPNGSRNKQPTKPRAKKVVVSEVVEPPPRWDAQHQPIPTEPHNEMAALMIKMLSGQSMERQRRKDAQRKAWFS
jgi:hypothetical protein